MSCQIHLNVNKVVRATRHLISIRLTRHHTCTTTVPPPSWPLAGPCPHPSPSSLVIVVTTNCRILVASVSPVLVWSNEWHSGWWWRLGNYLDNIVTAVQGSQFLTTVGPVSSGRFFVESRMIRCLSVWAEETTPITSTIPACNNYLILSFNYRNMHITTAQLKNRQSKHNNECKAVFKTVY